MFLRPELLYTKLILFQSHSLLDRLLWTCLANKEAASNNQFLGCFFINDGKCCKTCIDKYVLTMLTTQIIAHCF